MTLRGLAAGVVLSAALAACGETDEPQPDGEQIRRLVDHFFEHTAAKDVKAVCAVLTEVEDDCVRGRAPAALKSVDLPIAMRHGHRPGLEQLRVIGDRATGVVTFTIHKDRWAFRRTDDGWRIESFRLPVRE